MAQLRDTVVSGSLRATDSLLTTTLQAQILKVPTSNGGTSYGPGFNGYVLISNGTSTYWGTTTGISEVGTIVTGTWNATEIAVNKGGTGKTSWTPWGIIYASANTTLAQVTAGASGNNGYLLESKGAAAPDWIQATNSNTASTIVKRDTSGNFSAGTITATLSGSATSLSRRASLIKGTNPSSSTWLSHMTNFETGTGTDTKNRIGGYMESMIDTNGSTYFYLRAYQYAANSTTQNTLMIGCDNNGNCLYSLSDAAAFRKAISVGNCRVFYGTCSTAAATAQKVVVCSQYDELRIGDVMIVTFTANNTTNTALTMVVQNAASSPTVTTAAKSIKCQVVTSISDIPEVGYLVASRPYEFVYDGTYWVLMNINRDNDTYTKTRQQLRTTANENRPILFSGALTSVTTSNQDVITYRNNDIYVNAGEKLIYLQGKPVVFGEYSASTAPSSPVSGQVWLKQADMTIEEAKVLVIAVNSISSLPTTISNASITNDMQVINYEISNPGALNENIDYVTSNGSITLSGSLTGTTSLTLWLARCR